VSVVCVCSAPNNLISGNIIKVMPGSVASGTPYIIAYTAIDEMENVRYTIPAGNPEVVCLFKGRICIVTLNCQRNKSEIVDWINHLNHYWLRDAPPV